MPASEGTLGNQGGCTSVFAPHELAAIQPVIDAVCGELGVTAREMARRHAVAERVIAAYRLGRQLPLNMVDAGLSVLRRDAV